MRLKGKGMQHPEELEEEFAATSINTPLPGSLYFADIKSVSLGVVCHLFFFQFLFLFYFLFLV